MKKKGEKKAVFGRVYQKMQKEMKYLEPNGASKRTLYALPQTFDKAFHEIHTMKKKYDNERAEIRSKLNSPIKLCTELPPLLLFKTSEKYPKILKKKKTYNGSPSKSPYSLTPSDHSCKRLTLINEIMESCHELDEETKSARKNLPLYLKRSEKSYKNVNEIISEIEFMRPNNGAVSYRNFKKIVLNTENSVFLEANSLSSRSATRIESYSYLESKLRKKHLLKNGNFCCNTKTF